MYSVQVSCCQTGQLFPARIPPLTLSSAYTTFLETTGTREHGYPQFYDVNASQSQARAAMYKTGQRDRAMRNQVLGNRQLFLQHETNIPRG